MIKEEIMKFKKLNKLKKSKKFSKFMKIVKKPWLIFINCVTFVILIYMPVYFATVYEDSVFRMRQGMTQIEAAHYTNMINFGYQVAAITTVLIGYLMCKKIYKIAKSEV